MTKANRFSLDPTDIDYQRTTSRSRGKPGLPITDSRASAITLIHRPTGLQVTGEVPEGQYTNAQVSIRLDALYQALMSELTESVAKKLRLPGR